MAAEAARNALADAGLEPGDVDGFASFHVNDSSPSLRVAGALGIDDVPWCIDLLGGGNMAGTVVSTAAAAIRSGLCDTVVAFRSLNGRSGRRFGQAGRSNKTKTEVQTSEAPATAKPLHVGGEAQFGAPAGYLVPPQWMAMWARRHQHVYGSTCEDLGQIATTQRAHAVPNPAAVARKPLTMPDYLDGRWINEPLRVYDCTLEIDGACAVVITSLDRARNLRQPPVRLVTGSDSQAAGGSWEQWPDMTTMFSMNVAPRIWNRSGLGPDDIDVACIYDCFSYTVMAVMEDFGFFGKGEAGAFFGDGHATYGGTVVVNPHGGLLSEGYIHGLNHTYEAVLQLRGHAGPRQVDGAETALVTAGAGPVGGAVVYSVDH